MSPLGLFCLSLPTNVIDARYMESTGGKNSCTEEKNERKPGKIWPLRLGESTDQGRDTEHQTTHVWCCLLGKCIGNVWRFMVIAVWEAEGTQETHLFLCLLVF